MRSMREKRKIPIPITVRCRYLEQRQEYYETNSVLTRQNIINGYNSYVELRQPQKAICNKTFCHKFGF